MDMSGVNTEREIEEQERWEHRRRRLGWATFLWFFLISVALVVVFLPQLISLPRVRVWVVDHFNVSLAPAKLSVDEWSLRWLGEQQVKGIRFVDSSQGLALTIQEAKVSQGLLKLVPYRLVDAGTVTLNQPVVQVVLEKNGDRAAALWRQGQRPLADAVPPAGDASSRGGDRATAKALTGRLGPWRVPVRAEVIVSDGQIVVADNAAYGLFRVDDFNGTLSLRAWDQPVTIKAVCHVPFEASHGSVSLAGELPSPRLLAMGAFDDPAFKGNVSLSIKTLDLRGLSPLVTALSGTEWLRQGMVDLDAAIRFAGVRDMALEAELSLKQFSFAAPDLPPSPEGDVDIVFAATRDARTVALRSCDIRSPWGKVTADGRFNTTATAAVPTGRLAVTGAVDVAAVLRDFKPFIPLAEGVRAERGTLSFSALAEGDAQAKTLQVDVSADNLSLFYNDDPLRFSPAPQVAFALRLPYTESPELTRLDIVLPFARISGSGRLDRGTVSGQVDLTAFSREYRRILRACPPMVGQILFQVTAARNGAFSDISLAVGVEDLAVEMRPGKRMVIPRADNYLTCKLPLQAGGTPLPEAVDLKWMSDFGGGVISGAVARVEFPGQGRTATAGGITCALDLDLGWMVDAFHALLPLPAGTSAGGRLRANLTAEAAAGVMKGKFSSAGRSMSLRTTAWAVDEPDVRAEGAVTVDLGAQTLHLANFSLTAQAAQVNVPQFECAGFGGKHPLTLNGDADGTADLGVVSRWHRPSRQGVVPPQVDGKLRARLSATSLAAGTGLTLQGTLDDVTFTPANKGAQLREKQITLQAAATLATDLQTMTIPSLGVSSEWFNVAAKGKIVDLRGAAKASLSGTTALDYDVLSYRVAAIGMGVVSLSGKTGPRPFSFSGPLAGGLAPLCSFGVADGLVGVGNIHLLGLDLNAADTVLSLQDGVLTLDYQPVVGSGALRAKPVIQVALEPPVLEIGGALPLLDKVPLTQEFTDTLLAMVNPFLRGCLSGGGMVDLTAAEARIPLSAEAAKQVDTTFELTLHDTLFTAAGVLDEALDLVQIERRTITVKKTVIHAACREGRIVTEPFTMTVGNHTLRFQGSVGLDQSVTYLVELPLTEKLVGHDAWPYLKDLRLRVPVTGTLTNLQIDKEAGKKEIRHLLRTAAARALGEKAAERLQQLLQK